ncbi:MAG: hypothetical protein ABS81_05595 [Pseudonocardia sp. SCN 72-86]|nr:MAG: hypothetical protein ABS81_05595 [Pseudonocardia sp. SCN 72-86]
MEKKNRVALVAAVTVAVVAAIAVPTVALQAESRTVAQGQAQPVDRGDSGRLVSDTAIANLDPSLADVSARADRITYKSKSVDGRDVVVSGALLTPKGQAPAGGWPVVAWQHGSSGIADRCAPSTALNKDGKVDLYGYAAFVAQLLKAGYAVTATDYEGLGTDGQHPYIVADSEARGAIDSVRAGMEADSGLSNKHFLVGHSQGGHASIAASELEPTWGEGLDFRGVVGLAPVTDVGAAYKYGDPGPVDRGFYMLALAGLQTKHPDLRYADFLGPQALAMLPATQQECTSEIWTQFSANMGDELPDYNFTPQSPDAALKIQDWLDEESRPSAKSPAPMLLVMGSSDPSIRINVTKQAVQNAKTYGTDAAFTLYPGKDHYGVLAPRVDGGAADDVVDWLNAHVN